MSNRMTGTIVVAFAATILIANGADVVTDPSQIQLRIEQLETGLLPYQPARLQVAVFNCNCSKVVVSPPELYSDVAIKHKSRKFTSNAPLIMHKSGPRPTFSDYVDRASRAMHRLETAESVSVSYTISLTRETIDDEPDRFFPAFTSAGTYEIHRRFLVDSSKPKFVEIKGSIEVKDPPEAERAPLGLIKNNARLAYAILHPKDAPDKEVVRSIRDLIEKYPKSSYCPLANFSLAKHLLAQETEAAKKQAIEILDSLKEVNFAFRAEAVVLLLEETNRHQVLWDYCKKEFPDSIEWLSVYSEMIKIEEWREYRVRKAPKAKE